MYRKTTEHAISGWRIDPTNKKEVEFYLVNPKDTFSYDDDVLEIYSDKEDKFLIQRNRYLFEQGMLVEFRGNSMEVDMSNVLTDEDVESIATIKTSGDMYTRLQELNSKIAVERVFKTAQYIGRPAAILKVIKQRLEELTK